MRITSAIAASAATASALALTLAPTASADDAKDTGSKVFSNADGSVICQTTQFDTTHETLCVSDKARASQPECNPKDILIPAIAIQDKFVNLKCWNQGFPYEPERLSPFQVRRHGSATIIPGFSGSLYVFDSARFALIRAGERNAVIFGKR